MTIEQKPIKCRRCNGTGEVRPGRKMRTPRAIHSWIELACFDCYGDGYMTLTRFRQLAERKSA